MAAPALQMLTANRLRDGDVLYWKAGAWVLDIQQGEIFRDGTAADAALIEAQKFEAGNFIVKAYLFEVRMEKDAIHPVKEREIIRAAGPTVRRDTGKQASHV